jgi:enoyl-CoA hydratase
MADKVELETVYFETPAPGVAQVTLNRPDHANSVVPELARDLIKVFGDLERDRSVRAVILTGAGRQFSGGADMTPMRRYIEDRLPVENEPFNARVIFPVTQKIVTCRMPVLAAVNGGATAGGFDLSLACDIRIASTRAKFGETYIKIGMMPGNGGTYFLPRLIGSGMAAQMALTGEVIDAARAMEIGLVNQVVEPDELLPTTVALASQIAAKPWRALEATKQALRASWHMDLQTMFNFNYWAVAALSYTNDFKEGMDSFLEKRAPEFGASEPDSMHWDVA